MINNKFFVLLIYFSDLLALPNKYCKICPDHTLCIYEVSGPSPQCIGYDADAILTEDDSINIVDKINERRNLVATGRSRFLPAAANMKKIVWSFELATYAQRWADQCDHNLKPDRKDRCRDMDRLEVGQNIATITGSSSRYNTKTFVEMWFMDSMGYTGSVTYYNQSRDYKSNYFTQLIWANTDKVGCAKVKFYVKNAKPILVERLVCNFAPKGNEHGKPVYTIGYAATQCDSEMERDTIFSGLCSYRSEPEGKSQSSNPPATSLLRIRNLFDNNSRRPDIDPIFNNVKHLTKEPCIIRNHSEQTTMQNQKCSNYFYDAGKRSHPFENKNILNNEHIKNPTYYYYRDNIQKREKGNSRVYYGHDHKHESDYLHPETINQNARRYDYTLTINPDFYMRQEPRSIDQKCTRKSDRELTTYRGRTTECAPCKTKLNKCTRGQKTICPQLNDCKQAIHKCDKESPTVMHSTFHKFCACNSFSTTYLPNPNQCVYNTDCGCVNVDCLTKPYPYMLRTFKVNSDEKQNMHNDFQYYDILSNIDHRRSSTLFSKDSHRTRKIFLNDNDNYWPSNNKGLYRRKQLKRKCSGRKRELAGDENFRPFWQMDDVYVNKHQPELKSIKYTTLINRKGIKNKRTQKRPKSTKKTEPITIAYKERSQNGKRITEKYLSFDELMHLRKHNADDSGGRRLLDENPELRESKTTTASEMTTAVGEMTAQSLSTLTTPEYSFNTPYIRMKHCTRKLTCTWTAASLTDSAGSVISGGFGNAVGGSRTPPGYVEGCTRTSTCTRDYMNRNKMATLPVETTSPEPDLGDDEDYCERRSLNRRSNSNLTLVNTIFFFENFTDQFKSNKSLNDSINIRNKRQVYIREGSIKRAKNIKKELKRHISYETDLISYGDLYYYVVSKIIDIWKNANILYSHEKYCHCNGVNKIRCSFLIFFVTAIFITRL